MKAQHIKRIGQVALLTAMASLLSACGAATYRDTVAGSGSASSTTNPTSTPTPTSTPVVLQQLPPYQFPLASITGKGSYTTPSIDTDTKLVIRIRPGTQGGIVGGGNTPAPFTCMRYSVYVNDTFVKTTGIISNAAGNTNCPTAPLFEDIDASNKLSPGHGTTTVTIADVQSDARYLKCVQMYGWGWYACQNYNGESQYYTYFSTLSVCAQGDNMSACN